MKGSHIFAYLCAVGARILLCEISEQKEREEHATRMGSWQISKARKLTPY
jgi:hypothetical protein